MAFLGELGRFLEKGTEVLTEVSATLRDARETLGVLRPTLDALPGLVRETAGLVRDARSFLGAMTPLLAQAASKTLALLDAAREHVDGRGGERR